MAISTPISKVLAISAVHPNPDNIRELEDVETLAELIKSQGLLVAPKVFPHPDRADDWMLVDGHRRLAASRAAGLTEIRVEAYETMTRTEAVHVMISTGRGSKTATDAQVSKGVQTVLDLGESVTKVAKAQGMTAKEVKARAWVNGRDDTAASQYKSGVMPLEAAMALYELESQSGNSDLYAQTVEYLEGYPADSAQEVEKAIARARIELVKTKDLADLEELRAEKAPPYAGYNPRMYQVVEVDQSFEEHVAEGHLYEMQYSGEVAWYKREAKAQAEEMAPTPEEIAARENEDRMEANLRRLALLRPKMLAGLLKSKGLKDSSAKQILIDQVLEDGRALEVVGLLCSNVLPEQDEDQPDDEFAVAWSGWEVKVRRSMARLTLTQLVLLVELKKNVGRIRDVDWGLWGYERSLGDDRGWNDWNKLHSYFRFVIDALGYELDPDEVEVMQYQIAAAEERLPEYDIVPPAGEVTSTCGGCSQEVVADSEWAGRCMDCTAAAADGEVG